MAMNGSEALLYVGSEAVAKQTGLSRSRSSPTIDTSHKLSDLDEFIPGRGNGGTLTLNALFVPEHAGYIALRTAQDDKDLITVRITLDGEEWEEAQAMITQFDEDWPDNAVSTMSITLQVSGVWTDLESS